MSRDTIVYVERRPGWSARVELTATCVYFSTAVGDVLTPPEFWVLADLRRAGRRAWGLSGRSPWQGCGYLSDYEGRLYAPPEDGPAIRGAVVALLQGDLEPARHLAALLDPPSPELSPIPRPPRGHATFLGGRLHGQVRMSRAMYIDDAGKPVPARKGDAQWTGVAPVPAALYVRRTVPLSPGEPTVVTDLGRVYVHHSAARLWESRGSAAPENLWTSSDAR